MLPLIIPFDAGIKQGLIELLHLERSEYLGGDIKEFEDARLEIDKII